MITPQCIEKDSQFCLIGSGPHNLFDNERLIGAPD